MPIYPTVFVYATRRNILCLSMLVALAGLCAVRAQAQSKLRIGIVTPRESLSAVERSVLEGIRLGATEAKQTAQLFGGDVEVFNANSDGRQRGAVRAASHLSSARQIQVLLAVSAEDADTVSKFAEDHRVIFLNVSSRGDAIRAACRRRTFHIEASDAMYANAWRLFAVRQGPGRRTSPSPTDSVVLWHPRLERFGASQLNDRYRSAAQAAMDGGAWAGWAAIKIISEAALRTKSGSAEKLLAYLESPAIQLDGHKGWPLAFRATDHQLRQPLYIVVPASATRARAGARIVDVPDLAILNSPSSARNANDVLDLLSAGQNIRCPWKP